MTDLGLNLLYYWILCLVALKNVRLLLFFYNFLYFCSLARKENNDNEQENGDYSSVPFGYVCDDGTEYHW